MHTSIRLRKKNSKQNMSMNDCTVLLITYFKNKICLLLIKIIILVSILSLEGKGSLIGLLMRFFINNI